LCVPPLRYGGTQRGIADLCLGLRRRGHHLTLVAPGDSTAPADQRIAPLPAALWEETSPVPGPERADAAERYVDGVLQALAETGRHLDVVNVRFDHRRLLIGLVEMGRWPVVYSLHNPWSPFFEGFFDEPLASWVAQGRLRITAHSQAHRRQFGRLPHMQAVPYGMDVAAAPWSAQPLCPPPGTARGWEPTLPLLRRLAEQGKNYVVHIGNVSPMKAQAAAIAVARAAGLPLVLAGAPEPRDPRAVDYHRQRIAPLIDGGRVMAFGRASEVEKQELLRGATALLLTSGLDPSHPGPAESFGRPIMESLAAGTPVCAHAHASVPEVLPPGTGLLGDSVEELAAVLPRVAALDRTLCRRRAEEHFGLDRFAADLERVLRDVAGAAGRDDS
jgi:glycosyltransferase involved in cell wall biosynthesis